VKFGYWENVDAFDKIIKPGNVSYGFLRSHCFAGERCRDNKEKRVLVLVARWLIADGRSR